MQLNNMKGTRRRIGIAIMALILTVGLTSGAQAVLFDPDGNPGTPNSIDLGTFDWGPTSFLALGGNQAAVNFTTTGGACVTLSCQFDVLTHAKLIGTLAPNGTINTPTGIATNTFEITMVARFTEVVTGRFAGNTIATFATVPTAPVFFEIYFDSTPDAVDVSGSGFNDGRLILTGSSISNATGIFTINPAIPPAPLDGHNSDDYTGQLTLTGTGSETNLSVDSLLTDPTFFLQALAAFGITFANISQGLPYISVDPSDCYTGAAVGVAVGTSGIAARDCAATHVNGLMSANSPDALGGVVGNIGAVNGAFTGTNPDFVAQTDFNSPVTAAVPEPMSLLLFGFGLVGLSAYNRRNRSKN